ncbi:hypothetical protein U9R62_07855 [Cylindrospermopsis raciborskii DSH]
MAGAAALLWSENPTWTAQQVKNTLIDTGILYQRWRAKQLAANGLMFLML